MHLGSRGIALFLERATKPDLGAPGQHEESSTSRPARAARQEVHGVRGGGHRPASAVSPSLDGARSGWGRGSNLSYPPARTRRTSPNRDERRRGCPRAFPIAGVERFAVCPRVVFRIAEVVERRPDLTKRRARGQPLPAWPEVSPLAIRRGGERNGEKPCGDGKVTRTAEDPRRVLHDGRRPGSGKLSVFTDRRWKRSRLSPRVSSANAGWQPDPPRGGREPGWRARQGRPEVGSYARERRRKCLPRRRTGSLRRARCRETPGSPGTACVVQATRGRSREIDETRVLVAVLGSRSRQEASTVVVHGAPQGEPGHARPGPEPSLDAVDAAEGAQGSGERVCGARNGICHGWRSSIGNGSEGSRSSGTIPDVSGFLFVSSFTGGCGSGPRPAGQRRVEVARRPRSQLPIDRSRSAVPAGDQGRRQRAVCIGKGSSSSVRRRRRGGSDSEVVSPGAGNAANARDHRPEHRGRITRSWRQRTAAPTPLSSQRELSLGKRVDIQGGR